MIPQRTLAGTCEITTGALAITQRPPVFTGESAALNVQVAFKFQNVDYVLPETVVAEMYLRYPNTELMTVAVEMEKSDNTASGVLSAEQTGVAGYPLLVVQLTDMETSSLIVACATTVKVSDVRGDLVIDTRAPSPSEIVYIGRSPYINPSNGHWMQWDVSTNAYVDTDVIARGLPATFTAHAITLPEGSDATASIGGTALNPIINVGIPKGDKGAKGNTGSAAGFGTPTASVDANVGTPSVKVTASGPNTAKVFNFVFKNLKGQKGDTGGVSSVNDKTGSVQLNDEDIPSTIDGKGNVEAVLSYHSQQIANVQNGLAYIVGNTNTTGSKLEAGTFVYVKGHSSISEGLRKVTDTISANGSITTNNTEACTEGGLNELNSKVTTLYNGTAITAINVDLNTYHTLIFVMSDSRHVTITQDAVPNSRHYGLCSFYASEAIPLVIQNICFLINDSATGIYIDSTQSKQLNVNSDMTIGLYQASDLSFKEVYGISK